MLCGGNSNNPEDIFRQVVCINFYLEKGNSQRSFNLGFILVSRAVSCSLVMASLGFISLHFPFFLSINRIHMKKRQRIDYIGEL